MSEAWVDANVVIPKVCPGHVRAVYVCVEAVCEDGIDRHAELAYYAEDYPFDVWETVELQNHFPVETTWISVSNINKKSELRVTGFIQMRPTYFGDSVVIRGIIWGKVTHWRELPELPAARLDS